VPTYQYACTECGHRLEAVQSFTDDPLSICPECDGRLRKVFSAVGVVFKGSGFYRNDSRAANAAKETAGSGRSEKKSESTSESTGSKSSDKSSDKSSGKSDSKSSSPVAKAS
jgi:putative FmdB family regulatory protein